MAGMRSHHDGLNLTDFILKEQNVRPLRPERLLQGVRDHRKSRKRKKILPRKASLRKEGRRGSRWALSIDGISTSTKHLIQANIAPSAFKSNALPLHLNITHTPPVITEDDSTVPSASADPGFIGSTTLLPSVFSTGSYGWKGNKRVTIEVPNPEGGENEKLQVMITCVYSAK